MFEEDENGIVRLKMKGSVCFRVVNGLLYMIFGDVSDEMSQLLLPSSLRETMQLTAHELSISCRRSIVRTAMRVLSQFF